MERTYEVFPERKRKQRVAQKHWVEPDSIGVAMMRKMGFTQDVGVGDGLEFTIESERRGIGAAPPPVAKRESLQDVLDRVRSASPAVSSFSVSSPDHSDVSQPERHSDKQQNECPKRHSKKHSKRHHDTSLDKSLDDNNRQNDKKKTEKHQKDEKKPKKTTTSDESSAHHPQSYHSRRALMKPTKLTADLLVGVL